VETPTDAREIAGYSPSAASSLGTSRPQETAEGRPQEKPSPPPVPPERPWWMQGLYLLYRLGAAVLLGLFLYGLYYAFYGIFYTF
jgi:hypothetical protein